jgi:protein O-mannosyl-transferase
MTQRRRLLFILSLIALAVMSSWSGVFNDFAYDDRFIVLTNPLLHDLRNWWRFFDGPYWPADYGGDGYRPLTILLFACEWAAGHGRPWIFHAVNIALYAGVSVAVFFLAETCLPFAAAWAAAALFAVHPLHVEAVANVVGQSELLVALFLVVGTTVYIRARNVGELNARTMAIIAVLYALACLAKEHGIVLPALLLVAETVVVVDRTPLLRRLEKQRPFALALCAIALAFLWAHFRVSSESGTGFHPYVAFTVIGLTTGGRALTMLGLVPDWLRLFLWPAHLSVEYGPPAYPVVTDFQPYQIPGMLIVVATLALGVVAWRRAPAVSFGIWFLVITLLPTSNFIVPSGILIAERTLFLPSVGAVLVVAAVIPWFYRRVAAAPVRLTATAALAALVVIGAWRSNERTKIWKNNDTLFAAAVADGPDVYRSHFVLGAWDFGQKRKVKGEREYQKSIAMYDKDPFVFYTLGEEYRQVGMYRPAIAMFQRAIQVDTSMFEARARLALSYAGLGRWPEADREARQALTRETRSAKAMLGIIRLAGVARRNAAKDSLTRK